MHWLNWIFSSIIILISFFAAAHVLMFKRDPRASWAWIVTTIMLPPIGAILYFLLGINRVRTRAKKLKWDWPLMEADNELGKYSIKEEDLHDISQHGKLPAEYKQIIRTSASVTRRIGLYNNSIDILFNGEQAYPAMLKAIDQAKHRVYLATFIFEPAGEIGKKFMHSLAAAKQRGVDVRVLLDGVGEFYCRPKAGKPLKKKGIPFARFLPPKLIPPSPFVNLRNHRKLLVVDDCIGFTGGMNIRDRHLTMQKDISNRIQDIHFCLAGPIVHQMEQVFLEDWGFCTGDYHQVPGDPKEADGHAICRTITVGPNQDLNKLSMILTGAISMAKQRISILNPYFLPTREIIGALQSAALKGVTVNVVLPQKNNLPFVQWATQNMLWELLLYGVHIYYQPPPFAHSKLFIMDGFYAQIGSANLDPRSLRLNFEMNVEVLCPELVLKMNQYMDQIIARSRETFLEEVDSRSLPIRARDSICWLFSPYF